MPKPVKDTKCKSGGQGLLQKQQMKCTCKTKAITVVVVTPPARGRLVEIVFGVAISAILSSHIRCRTCHWRGVSDALAPDILEHFDHPCKECKRKKNATGRLVSQAGSRELLTKMQI